MATASSEDTLAKKLVIDPFCFRQFAECESSKGYTGTVFNISIKEFEQIVNSRFDPSNLHPGYAPFCKHIFLKNDFTDARVCVLPITPDNEHCLRTKYEARSEKELPIVKENAAMGKDNDGGKEETAPWGIVSIKAQDVDHELPMTPITAMRNALGKEEGGSGVPLDRDSYMAAFEYWKDHATVV
eukprot:g6312.t1 g6312   contig23:176184-176987(-)